MSPPLRIAQSDPSASMRKLVARFVRGEADNLDFKIGSLDYRPSDFRVVADRLENGKIAMHLMNTEDPAVAEEIKNGAGAVYDATINRLECSKAIFKLQPHEYYALILHEMVHAVNDLRKRKVNQIENEMSGYVAEQLSLLANGKQFSFIAADPLRLAAREVAMRIQTGQTHHAELNQLRSEVRRAYPQFYDNKKKRAVSIKLDGIAK